MGYDLIIIGGGPGGYVAAIRAGQLGRKVALVEERERLGGVCLNEGCIPSKALLDSSELFAQARDRFGGHGIVIDPPKLDLAKMMLRKDDVVKKLTDGVVFLCKKNKVTWIKGKGRLLPRQGESHRVEVTAADGTQLLEAPRVILATGSEAVPLPHLPVDGKLVVTAREALSFDTLPEHLVVVGGGYIGLELGSVWRRLGSQVTVVEMLPNLIPTSDGEVATHLSRALKKQGIKFLLETKVTALRQEGGKGILTLESAGGSEELSCDKVLVAVGRRPLTAGLGLEELGITRDPSGRIAVNADYETNVAGIYALGDLIAGPMLAHKAMEEGVVCVERMQGEESAVEYDYLPGIVYTWPEGASVGATEERLKSEAIPYKGGKFPFMANGRAKCMDETEGFVKILAHAESGQLLGVHILGPRASDLIAEAVAVMSFGGTAQDIALMFHAHPTLSEAVKEAALDVEKRAIHA